MQSICCFISWNDVTCYTKSILDGKIINKRAKRPWIAHLSIQAKSQTFDFEIWVTFDQSQRMTLTIDTHST